MAGTTVVGKVAFDCKACIAIFKMKVTYILISGFLLLMGCVNGVNVIRSKTKQK